MTARARGTRGQPGAACEVDRVSQPRVGDLARGQIDRFGIYTQIPMLGHPGLVADCRGATSGTCRRKTLAHPEVFEAIAVNRAD
jgi:hypothetical protein